MSWNHRVVKRTFPATTPDGKVIEVWGIHEAYDMPEDDGKTDGLIDTLSVDPETISADSMESLRWMLEQMLLALNKPVLEYETAVGQKME